MTTPSSCRPFVDTCQSNNSQHSTVVHSRQGTALLVQHSKHRKTTTTTTTAPTRAYARSRKAISRGRVYHTITARAHTRRHPPAHPPTRRRLHRQHSSSPSPGTTEPLLLLLLLLLTPPLVASRVPVGATTKKRACRRQKRARRRPCRPHSTGSRGRRSLLPGAHTHAFDDGELCPMGAAARAGSEYKNTKRTPRGTS